VTEQTQLPHYIQTLLDKIPSAKCKECQEKRAVMVTALARRIGQVQRVVTSNFPQGVIRARRQSEPPK
jgi:hypothetical protein